MTAPPIAVLRDLSHRYGSVCALDRVTLDIPAGCMAGLIGPDGVGKSTLLTIVAGVRRLQHGRVDVLGGDVRDAAHAHALRARIAYMPQGLGRNLYPSLSVVENLDFFARLHGQGRDERRARIDALLQATGLAPFPDRPAGQLSGGMKQKLGLCSVLLHDPDLLVMDEPTTGVDPLSRRQFWSLIDNIRARRPGMSVLVATAYMEEAERFDWLAAFDAGRVIAHGAPQALKRSTGAATMDAAFLALLPPEKRAAHQPVAEMPRAPDGHEVAIEADGLTRRFGDFVAVDDVHFKITRGEIFGFLGSNGCGKTTTMKMLTGLLPASAGTARLLGKPLDAGDPAARLRVGYMSQSFSLYGELTVRQNLELHAQLFRLPRERRRSRVEELLARFELEPYAHRAPLDLPLGVRQRLQLATAILHKPDLLILDEPTSGVDPVARDNFWRYLLQLARQDGVTIFLSTHFMNEAERCDRISLMHAGRVLAVGPPAELVRAQGATTLEDAFIRVLEQAGGADTVPDAASSPPVEPARGPRRFELRRLLAYARREALEILRDPIRLAFALLGPLLLMVTFGYGISFDVEHLNYAVLDQDRTVESRRLLEQFEGSRYFDPVADVGDMAALDGLLRAGRLALGVEIPAGFGRDLEAGRRPEVSIWLDGAMPFRAETTRGYVAGLAQRYLAERATRSSGARPDRAPFSIEPRFLYNQSFRSVFAIVPSVIVLMLVLIPAIMATVGVVREKETGSIANFRSTPVSRIEFFVGKQLPYVAIAAASFALLMVLALFLFGVPVKGSVATLALGSVLYVFATTGFGLLVSCFVRSQVAAVFATAILAMIPAVNFSGLLVPVSSLSGGGRLIGLLFPAAWYQLVTVGTFTKGLGFADLWLNLLILALFGMAFLGLACLFLRKQEA